MALVVRHAVNGDVPVIADFAIRLFAQHRAYDPDRFADIGDLEGSATYYASRIDTETSAVLVARERLSETFHIAIRVREIGEGKGFRIYQTRKEGNRHLVDLRSVSELPKSETIENVSVLSPVELIASKVISYHSRKGRPKSGTDWRDIAELLLRFPELKEMIAQVLRAKNIGEPVLRTWAELASQDFRAEHEDVDLDF